MKSLARPLAAAALLLSAVAADAAVVYSNRAAFEATLGASFTENYDSAAYEAGDLFNSSIGGLDIYTDAAMSAIAGQTRYTTTGRTNFNIITKVSPNTGAMTGNYYCAGCNGSFLLDFTATSFGGASGVFGVGLNFASEAEPYLAFVKYGDGSTQNFTLGSVPSSSPAFFGLTSTAGITSIAFGLIDGGATTDGLFGIDNLTIGRARAQQVPEPAGWALVTMALAMLALAGRRNRT